MSDKFHMVKGIAFFSWDTKMGATLEMEYPPNLKLTDHLIHKVYLTHSYEEDFKKGELIEVSYNDQIILSFCDKTKVADVGYEVVLIILDEKEKIDLYNLKSHFIEFAKELLKHSEDDRKKFFMQNITSFLDESHSKKILLVGRPGTGKTTIKKIVFEGNDPKELLFNPLEPTRGILPSVYSWLDLELGLFDSSGQELNDLLENKLNDNQNLVFEKTDIIIYVFDYPTWSSNTELIKDDVQQLLTILKENSPEAKLILFFHKIDLIKKAIRKNTLMEITKAIKEKYKVSIYYTSIFPKLIYNLYNAFYELLSSFSKEYLYLKSILDTLIKDFSKTMFFITNLNDSIIAQSMSKDFNTLIINHSHKLIAQLNKSFENMSKTDKIEHLILSSSNTNIIMNNLNYQKYGLKQIVCLSEVLSANKLIWLIGQITLRLKDVYYLKKKIL